MLQCGVLGYILLTNSLSNSLGDAEGVKYIKYGMCCYLLFSPPSFSLSSVCNLGSALINEAIVDLRSPAPYAPGYPVNGLMIGV